MASIDDIAITGSLIKVNPGSSMSNWKAISCTLIQPAREKQSDDTMYKVVRRINSHNGVLRRVLKTPTHMGYGIRCPASAERA